jgi:hypothetical protein
MGSAALTDRASHEHRSVTPDVASGRTPAPSPPLLSLQRSAGNAAVGALLRGRRASVPRPRPEAGRLSAPMPGAERALAAAALARRVARCTGGSCGCGKAGHALDDEFPLELDGKGMNPDAELEEELEGHAAGPPRRRLQRLTITQHKLTKGDCGQRNVQWVFSLDAAAPEDGYIVQHIRSMGYSATCPDRAVGPPAIDKEFWEAWLVKKGDKVDWTTTRDSWTDGSVRPSNPGKNGTQSSLGTLKFFKKSTTGDLGDFGVAPAGATSTTKWGPGKVATSGALPSTATKPSWWDNAPVEGPVDREATSVWDCCDADATKRTSTVTAKP